MKTDDPKKPVADQDQPTQRSRHGGDLIGKGPTTEDDKQDDGTDPETARKPY